MTGTHCRRMRNFFRRKMSRRIDAQSITPLPSLQQVYLLFGKTGWLGGKLTTLLRDQGKTVHLADSRLENRESVLK